jgi:hypothetical protein
MNWERQGPCLCRGCGRSQPSFWVFGLLDCEKIILHCFKPPGRAARSAAVTDAVVLKSWWCWALGLLRFRGGEVGRLRLAAHSLFSSISPSSFKTGTSDSKGKQRQSSEVPPTFSEVTVLTPS